MRRGTGPSQPSGTAARWRGVGGKDGHTDTHGPGDGTGPTQVKLATKSRAAAGGGTAPGTGKPPEKWAGGLIGGGGGGEAEPGPTAAATRILPLPRRWGPGRGNEPVPADTPPRPRPPRRAVPTPGRVSPPFAAPLGPDHFLAAATGPPGGEDTKRPEGAGASPPPSHRPPGERRSKPGPRRGGRVGGVRGRNEARGSSRAGGDSGSPGVPPLHRGTGPGWRRGEVGEGRRRRPWARPSAPSPGSGPPSRPPSLPPSARPAGPRLLPQPGTLATRQPLRRRSPAAAHVTRRRGGRGGTGDSASTWPPRREGRWRPRARPPPPVHGGRHVARRGEGSRALRPLAAVGGVRGTPPPPPPAMSGAVKVR